MPRRDAQEHPGRRRHPPATALAARRAAPLSTPRTLGAAGEDAACRWLAQCGLDVVARGFRSRYGEIDVVALDRGTVVFVEVKTRTPGGIAPPADAVTGLKRHRLVRTAALWLARARAGESPCRFDVIEVEPREGRWRIRHRRDAFRPGD
ncbi:MAG TPA: YraN family protein [Candidatus Polarisedimenticolaceae bacterium]|nr:YraN family protein [Candidatus Polarisedimenticolaceae bacterium]